MARVAVDAMGGDHAPREIVAGAVMAAGRGLDVVLVGDEAQLVPLLAEHGADLPIRHAAQAVAMGDHPTRALRERPDSSILVATDLVRDGLADAVVSAGSTGAAMAAAVLRLGRLRGIQRPAIASVIPAPSPVVLLDAGANPDVKPEHLVEFAILGAVLAETYFEVDPVRVGLLNIGEEKGKGRDLEKAAWDLLERLDKVDRLISFVGNVEGRDLASGKAHVIVTDGFAGNIALKAAEGALSLAITTAMLEAAKLPAADQAGVHQVLAALRKRFDHETTGGAHLLGTNGVVVIAHGSSTAKALAEAIELAAGGADRDLVGRVRRRLIADLDLEQS